MLQRTWKPDRDWNIAISWDGAESKRRCNELENPIGIETCGDEPRPASWRRLQRTWKPDRDWNLHVTPATSISSRGCNELENPIGIETFLGAVGFPTAIAVATNLKTR